MKPQDTYGYRPKFFSQKAPLFFAIALGYLGLTISESAHAGCTDPAAPHVDWGRCLFDGRNLEGVDLTSARIRGASFLRARLNAAVLSGSDGFRSKFISAELEGVHFDKAKLSEADFTKAVLVGASFIGADLRRSRFTNANLSGVNFTGANLRGTQFRGADLSGAIWTDGITVCQEGSQGLCQ